jgi:hypothetical protein
VWDSSGAVTERLGREGDGPGESSGTVGVLFDGQRYHVLGGDGRWTILKSNGEYVSSVAGLFAPPGLNIIVDDTLVVSGWAGQSQFRVTDLTSGRQTELGKAYGDGIPDAWTIGEARGPGEFWAVSPGGDRVERWSVGGELLETLVTSGTVYDPASTREGLHAPQPHYFLDLMVGEDLIWVVGGLREGSLEGPPTNFVEVLDRWTGRSLAHALEGRYGPLLHGFIDSSTGWIAVEDELGATEIKLRSFGLVKSAG